MVRPSGEAREATLGLLRHVPQRLAAGATVGYCSDFRYHNLQHYMTAGEPFVGETYIGDDIALVAVQGFEFVKSDGSL
jgi:hypothetical protein